MPSQDMFRKKMGQRRGTVTGDEQTEIAIRVTGDFSAATREELEQQAEALTALELDVTRLLDNPYQHLARTRLDEEKITELTNSILNNGFFGALLARPKPGLLPGDEKQYELAYGHRRREAARRLGLKTLPVKVIDLSNEQMARVMASENFSREDLTPVGEANVIGLLYTQQNMSIKQIAEVTGKGRGWVEHRIALYEAPAELREMVEERPDTLTYVRVLTQVTNPAQRTKLIQQILNNTLTRDKVQKRVQELKEQSSGIVKNSTNIIPDENSEIRHNNWQSNNRTNEQKYNSKVAAQTTEAILNQFLTLAQTLEDNLQSRNKNLSQVERRKIKEIISSLEQFL